MNHHNKFSQTLLKILTLLFAFLISFQATAQDVDDIKRQKNGRKLFNANCASCHKLDKKFTGPALGGIEERRENVWLKAWIKNNAALRASGDAEAIAVYEEYKQANMTAFPQLSDQQIDDILYYTTVGDPPKKTSSEDSIPGKLDSGRSKWLIWILAVTIAVAFLIIANLLKTISELKGVPETPGLLGQASELWQRVKKNTFLHVLFVIFGALMMVYFLFGTLFKVGVNQGYQPIQPILFSHKIHAGDNKIECQYCHSAARHSKHSGIPSLNICMNCHMNISEVAENTKVVLEDEGRIVGKTELDKEIAKLYDHVGWDVKELKYTGEFKPVEWVRIHNLPDFAYFNHSQHVTVAGIKCQKCHGPVEEMEELYQYSPLTMGWCIDCHKETNIDLKGNEYYAKIHEKLANKYGVDKVTIAQLGGKECGKCHY